jgi:hypothetical protein
MRSNHSRRRPADTFRATRLIKRRPLNQSTDHPSAEAVAAAENGKFLTIHRREVLSLLWAEDFGEIRRESWSNLRSAAIDAEFDTGDKTGIIAR